MTIRSILLSAGTVALCISSLPWLGLGSYYFSVPGWNIELPRLHWIESSELYHLIEVPLEILGSILPLGDVLFFPKSGPVVVQPFYLFLSYHLSGWFLLWVGFRAPLDPIDEWIQSRFANGNAADPQTDRIKE